MNEAKIKTFVTQKDWVFIGEGWDNVVYANKQKTSIFRIPKKPDGPPILKMEEQVLPMLAEYIDGVTIPVPSVMEEDSVLYAEYPYVVGKQYPELLDVEKYDLINKLGTALQKLHTIDIFHINKLSEVDYHTKYTMIFERVIQELSVVLNDEQMAYAVDLFEAYIGKEEYKVTNKSILHGDISFDHVYYQDGHISIIDWSDMHISDPAREFYHVFRSISNTEKDMFIDAYNEPDELFWKRASIYPLLDTFEVLLIVVKKKQSDQVKEFLKRVEQDMLDWRSQS